jgi:hypothetical protein
MFSVVSKEKSFILNVNNNIEPQKIATFSVYDGIKWYTVESTSVIEEEWTHLAATFEDSTIKIYVNGEYQGSLSNINTMTLNQRGVFDEVPLTSLSSDEDLIIGAYMHHRNQEYKTKHLFSGQIDGIQLFNVKLSPELISGIYDNQRKSDVQPLLAEQQVEPEQIVVTSEDPELTSEADDYGFVAEKENTHAQLVNEEESEGFKVEKNPEDDSSNTQSLSNVQEFESAQLTQGSATITPPTASTDHTVTLQHEDIEINQLVRWIGTVNFTDPQPTVAVEIPSTATMTQVLNSVGEIIEFSDVADPALFDPFIPVVQITDAQVLEEGAQTKLILIEQSVQNFTIEFETPAPYTEEIEQTTTELPEDLVEGGLEFKLYWMIDGVKTDVTDDPSFAVEFVDTDGNGIVDQMQWMVPQLSKQVFVIEAELAIINVQSFPTVGGEWVVKFTTKGTGNLKITGFNGTTFGEALPDDLKFLELNDGTQTLEKAL